MQSSRVTHYAALSKLFPEVDKNVKPYICGVIQAFWKSMHISVWIA